MTPDQIADLLRASRRSFLGWTLAVAGASLLTRPALALPEGARLVKRVDVPVVGGRGGMGMRQFVFAKPMVVHAGETVHFDIRLNAAGQPAVFLGEVEIPLKEPA